MRRRHYELAKQLYQALLRKELTWPRPVESIREWAEHFALLEHEDRYSAKRIQRVLNWYCHSAGKDWVPQAYSGGTFRIKFDRIEAAAKRMPIVEKINAEITRIDTKAKGDRQTEREWKRFTRTHSIGLVAVPNDWQPDYSKMPMTDKLKLAVDRFFASCEDEDEE